LIGSVYTAKTVDLVDVDDRLKIIQVNEAFRKDTLAFREEYKEAQGEITHRIEEARNLLSHVNLSPDVLESVAKSCINLKVDGCRPDIVIVKAAKANAAFNGRDQVSYEDMTIASELALTHRTRGSGQASPPSSQEIQEMLENTPLRRVPTGGKDHIKTLVSRRTVKKSALTLKSALNQIFS